MTQEPTATYSNAGPRYGMQPALEFLESAHMMWDNTVNKAYRIKGEIQPLQNAAADGVRKDIAAFGEEVGSARTSCPP